MLKNADTGNKLSGYTLIIRQHGGSLCSFSFKANWCDYTFITAKRPKERL